MSKKEQSDELEQMVQEFKKNGGKVEQVPEGVSAEYLRFNGHRTADGKVQLYNLSESANKNRIESGFRRERIVLSPKQ
jgi:hypothetical protein|tara:strand:+ start:437 stop:670 length:234 start_codon:yes stop_codon:yes gene_type:complete